MRSVTFLVPLRLQPLVLRAVWSLWIFHPLIPLPERTNPGP